MYKVHITVVIYLYKLLSKSNACFSIILTNGHFHFFDVMMSLLPPNLKQVTFTGLQYIYLLSSGLITGSFLPYNEK